MFILALLTERSISPIETQAGASTTEPVLTTERRGGKLIFSEGPIPTEQTVLSRRKTHQTEGYSSPKKAAYKRAIEGKRPSVPTAFYTEACQTDRYEVPERPPRKEDKHLRPLQNYSKAKTPSPNVSKDMIMRTEFQNTAFDLNEVSFRANPNTPTQSGHQSKDNLFYNVPNASPIKKTDSSLNGRRDSPQPTALQRRESEGHALHKSFIDPNEPSKSNNVFEFYSGTGAHELQKPKQIFQKNPIRSIKMRARSFNVKRSPKLDKSQETNNENKKNLEREYLSFKPPPVQESMLFRAEEQFLMLENKSQLAKELEKKSKLKELNVLRDLIRPQMTSRVCRKHSESPQKKKSENIGNSNSRLGASGIGDESSYTQGDTTPKQLRGPTYRSNSRPENERFIDLSTLVRRRQTVQQPVIEWQEKIPYPIRGIRGAKPSIETIKQIRVARKLRRAVSKAEEDDDKSRIIHSFKP